MRNDVGNVGASPDPELPNSQELSDQLPWATLTVGIGSLRDDISR
jgi:hypothetical protein